MTRIVAGRWKGRRLTVPRVGVRPTSERVREAVFNTLRSYLDGLTDLTVLDLYAGSGALALEALSRGAGRAVLVDRDRSAVAAIRANVAALDAAGAEVLPVTVAALARRVPPPEGAQLVLADPPYDLATTEVAAVLADLVAAGWIAEGAVVVVETGRRAGPSAPWPADVEALTQRDYGDTRVWYGRARTSSPPSDDEG